MRCLVAAVLGAIAVPAAAAPPARDPARSWAEIATGNINALHDLISDNHPGPVDPLNPKFRVWLEEGRTAALKEAASARDRAQARRVLLAYINGFRDGHLSLDGGDDVGHAWPGFLTASDTAGRTRVAVAEAGTAVSPGDELVACDGTSAADLLEARVHRYYTNADIPHERLLRAPRLFVVDADDAALRLKACTFRSSAGENTVALNWSGIAEDDLRSRLLLAQGRVLPELGVREVDGVWFVSVPSFNWWGERAALMRAFLQELNARSAELHRAPIVVVDVRGNGGGNSSWGYDIAIALWGEQAVSDLTNSFDFSVDWRASELNARLMREMAKRSADAGLKDDAQYRLKLADELDAARARGEALYPAREPPTSKGLSAGYRSPFAGRVYFLTDLRCASACLDFADVMRRMPGVVHVGLPTSADAVYIDNVSVPLPSKTLSFSYSLKVYRHRVRGNNEWYAPARAWPGGFMHDETIAAWVKTLR